jgi:hypothetical protein
MFQNGTMAMNRKEQLKLETSLFSPCTKKRDVLERCKYGIARQHRSRASVARICRVINTTYGHASGVQ